MEDNYWLFLLNLYVVLFGERESPRSLWYILLARPILKGLCHEMDILFEGLYVQLGTSVLLYVRWWFKLIFLAFYRDIEV